MEPEFWSGFLPVAALVTSDCTTNELFAFGWIPVVRVYGWNMGSNAKDCVKFAQFMGLGPGWLETTHDKTNPLVTISTECYVLAKNQAF